MRDNCKDNGTQKKTNLSRSQTLGLRSLSRRVAKVEIVVLEADKGKKFVVVDKATYKAMALDHTRGDIRVSRDEVRYSQRILSSTAKSLANMVSLGSAHSQKNYARCLDNCGSQAEDVPTLRLLPKVHKPPGQQGHPTVPPSSDCSCWVVCKSRRPGCRHTGTNGVLEETQDGRSELGRSVVPAKRDPGGDCKNNEEGHGRRVLGRPGVVPQLGPGRVVRSCSQVRERVVHNLGGDRLEAYPGLYSLKYGPP